MTSQQRSTTFPMIIIGALFFIFGFITWLNSVLIPFLQQACQLTDFQAYFVTLAFYISYFVMAIPASAILRKIGFSNGMSVGLVVMALGALVFIPAALIRSYPVFLVGLFIQATGLTLLQTASNPYVTILGPIESAGKRISIMGICNKIAGMIGILVLVELLFSDTKELSTRIASLSGAALESELDVLTSRLITPYVIVAIGLLALAFMVRRAHLPEIPEEENADQSSGSATKSSIWEFPHLILGVLCIFVYVGVEVIAIDTIGLYGQYQGFDLETSTKFGVYSLIALTIGYLIGIVVMPTYISQRNALIVSAGLGFLFVGLAMLTSGWLSIGFIVLLSFAHALMWPAIWPLSIAGLGRFTKTGSALLIMGIVGGAIFPLIYGALADSSNRQSAYWIMLPCYVYILYFAAKGSRAGKRAEVVSAKV